jgi:DNA-binding cell septation regulator SpoVG
MNHPSPAQIERGNALLHPAARLAAAAVKIAKLAPHRSGQMLAFLSVETPSGLVIHDCRLMAGRNGAWIAMPSKPQVDRDGNPRLDANGKALYSPVVEFANRAAADRFRDLVLDALRRQHPEALAGDGL